MEDRIYSVYELNIMVKGFLEDNELFRDFFLTGEISNITYYKSGHLYFTLKDERASVKCVAFHYKYKKIGDNLKEGDLIKLFGRVSLYEANGSYQVLVSHIEKENKLGILYQELEKVKRELAEKGYFDEHKKKPIPKVPRTVGIVTSGTGAAIRDIINTGRSRFPNINFIVYPCKVQGEGSVEEIIKGIEILNKIDEVDVIIAGRGGGSIEDLWSFNIKETAMAFYNSKKPIVSAVGHEIDTVLTDYIADIRAATPTHASELVIPRKSDLKEKISMRNIRIRNLMKSRIEFEKERLVNKKDTYVIKNFLEIIREKNIFLMEKEERINSLLSHKIKEFRHQLQLKNEKIKGLNPKEILKRGYTITSKDGKVVKDLNNLHLGDKIETYFYTGKIISEVKEKL
jgi:exodeoxyribonuclease VII large subunit